MYFSTSTVAVILTALAATSEVSAGPSLEGRATSLCNQKNYGASGAPWNSNSSPGAWCGKSKPSNQGQWKNLPYWDGGDVVKCSGSGKRGLKVCNGGNSHASLPSTCNPPHNFPSNWGKGGSYTVKCTPAQCSWATWWNCYLPSAWRQTCTIVYNAPTTPGKPSASASKPVSSAAASSAPASSAAASSAAASSAAASSAVASSAAASSAAASPAASSDAASSAAASPSAAAPSDPASSAAAPSDPASSVVPSPVSSAAPVQTSTAAVDPTDYPVCNAGYQVTYTNYTRVALNGVYTGMTVGAATQDASYMTYTLASNPADCLAACDQIEGCVFVNTYIDREDDEEYLPKHTPGVYTCAMFSACVGTEKNDNWGGMNDPNIIEQSNGYCKSGACSS